MMRGGIMISVRAAAVACAFVCTIALPGPAAFADKPAAPPGGGAGGGGAVGSLKLDAGAATSSLGGGGQSSLQQTDTTISTGVAGSGQIGAMKSIQLQDQWSLQMGAGVDMDQSTRSGSGELNGRVGLGLKF